MPKRIKNEWCFYKTYKQLNADSSYLASNEFLSFTKVYIFYPYRYLQFEVYESSNLLELKTILLSEETINDYIDIYIVRYDFKYCIKYGKAEHQQRDFLLQTIE